MEKVQVIKKDIFYKKYKIKEVDLVKLGLFSEKDLEDLVKLGDYIVVSQKYNTKPSPQAGDDNSN